jgi:hypothetical protein
LEVGQTIKGAIEKIYLVCYPIFGKKETSCKEIGWGHPTQNYLDRRFLMSQEDRANSGNRKFSPILAEMEIITTLFS